MPTGRAWLLLIIAVVLYLLANQTQVGWVYLMADALLGLLVAAFLYSWGMLDGIQVKRTITVPARPADGQAGPAEPGTPELAPPTFFEDDPAEVTLRLSQAGRKPVLLVSGSETAPFAPPADQVQPFWLPSLMRGRPVELSYQVSCDRRGLYTLPDLVLRSAGPFGLFKARRTISAPGNVLIYPRYQPLKRLRPLERRELADRQARRLGGGSQVMGTREYRSGDSLRQIHWRSTAHAGKLVVKEFTEEEQASLSVVLDLAAGSDVGEGKFSTFETAVRLAASLAYYADQKKMPFYLVGAGRRPGPAGNLPPTPLGWWAALNYLARVTNDGDQALAGVLEHLNRPSFVVVLASRPDAVGAAGVVALARRGVAVLAVLITLDGTMPAAWPDQKLAGLEVCCVSPHNWVRML